jgi:hypothetical protein
MNQKVISLHIFFITLFVLSHLAAMQDPKIITVNEHEQQEAAKKVSLSNLRPNSNNKKLRFLDDQFVFKAIKIREIDYQHHEICCSAIIAGKKCIVHLFLEKENDSVQVFWCIVSIVDDFEHNETYINPVYNLESGELWFKLIHNQKTSILRQIFGTFVGRYLIYMDSNTIMDKKCYSCGKNLVFQTEVNLIILSHYRLSGGGILCEKCGQFVSLKITPQNILYVKCWLLPPYGLLCNELTARSHAI